MEQGLHHVRQNYPSTGHTYVVKYSHVMVTDAHGPITTNVAQRKQLTATTSGTGTTITSPTCAHCA